MDERKQTLYDPLHTWEDHEACWQMQVLLTSDIIMIQIWSVCFCCLLAMISNFSKIR